MAREGWFLDIVGDWKPLHRVNVKTVGYVLAESFLQLTSWKAGCPWVGCQSSNRFRFNLKDSDVDVGNPGLRSRGQRVGLADDGHDFRHGVLLSVGAHLWYSVSMVRCGDIVVAANASREECAVVGQSWFLEHVVDSEDVIWKLVEGRWLE